MNTCIASGAALASLLTLPLLATAATPSQSASRGQSADQLAVGKLEQRWVADIAQGNRDDLAGILADDYRDINWQGRVRDKHALLAGIRKSADPSQRVTELHVRTWGDGAVATGINEVRSASKGWTIEVAFTDVFARIDGHWRAVSSQETVRKPSGGGA